MFARCAYNPTDMVEAAPGRQPTPDADPVGIGGAIPDAALTPATIARAVRSGRATSVAAAEAVARRVPVRRGDGYALPDEPVPGPPPPRYASWAEWCEQTTVAEKRRWCQRMADTANRPRLLSGSAAFRLTGADVWRVLETAHGRCVYCGSLAVEHRPSDERGKPIPWASVGRRIGSLGHRISRLDGGGNEPTNLAWTCLWCNDWKTERRPGATDHGGVHPAESPTAVSSEPPYPTEYVARQGAAARATGDDDDGELGPDLDVAAEGGDPYWYITRD